ncbi:hypothetical protein ACFL27_14585 [candidate division CSSED10-310 bacterium]|uniref:4Fe-4S ferredoxin-type domain-containing protein n=1 Tax=candidate division CSSED10-310 bacterium TaxID=2855610 RepID=A0ABV6YYZ6_UNCC1
MDAFPMDGLARTFQQVESNLLVRIVFNHRLQRYFQAIRATRFFDYLCSTHMGGKILYKSGIRQDIFSHDDLLIENLTHNPQLCRQCGKCKAYCPMDRPLPEGIADQEGCLQCLYCYLVCPEQAISLQGQFGFFNEQIHQYGAHIKKIV